MSLLRHIAFPMLLVAVLLSYAIGGVKGDEIPGTEKWRFHTGGSIHACPALGSLYVGSPDGNLYSINLSTGMEQWRFSTGSDIHGSAAIGDDGVIYVGARNHNFYAITPDGYEKWRFRTSGWVYSSPAIAVDGTIYVGSYDNNLYALDPTNGAELWRFPTGGAIFSSPAVGVDGTIYVGSRDSKIYAIYPNGDKKWEFPTGGNVDGSPTIDADGTIYVGSNDHYLYALDPNGIQIWRFETGGLVDSSVSIGLDGTLYFGSWDNYVYAIDPVECRNDPNEARIGGKGMKWRFPTGGSVRSSPAIGASGTIYIGSLDEILYAIKPNGDELWHFVAGGPHGQVWSPTIGPDGVIYVGSENYNLYAVYSDSAGLADTPWPGFRHDLRNTGRAELRLYEVTIDIKPRSFPNSINPAQKGTTPVAIFSTDGFDAPALVDPTSLTFGSTGDEESLAYRGKNNSRAQVGYEDVNNDGLLDVVAHFVTELCAFEVGDQVGYLEGETFDGPEIYGSDSVRIVPSYGKKDTSLDPMDVATQLEAKATPTLLRERARVRFEVKGALSAEVDQVRVRVFDLAGDLVWEGEAAGTELPWNAVNTYGQHLANGVYIFQVLANVNGTWVPVELSTMTIIR